MDGAAFAKYFAQSVASDGYPHSQFGTVSQFFREASRG